MSWSTVTFRSKGRAISIEEKPARPRSDLALVGVYMFDRTVWEAVEAIRQPHQKLHESAVAIQKALELLQDG